MPVKGKDSSYTQVPRKNWPKALWPPVLWFATIWVVSSLPGQSLPAPKILSLDKVAHIGVYFLLGLLTNRALHLLKADDKKVWAIYLIILATAALDELHQYLIPQRSVSIWDFTANALGLALACGAFWIKRDRG